MSTTAVTREAASIMITPEDDVSWMIAATPDVNRDDVTVMVEPKERTHEPKEEKELVEQSEGDDDCYFEKLKGGTEGASDPDGGILGDAGSPTQPLQPLSPSLQQKSNRAGTPLSPNDKARRITLKRLEGGEYGRAVILHKRNNLPKFDLKEIARGQRLGKGSFSNVDEIRGIHIHNPPTIKSNPLTTSQPPTTSTTTANTASTTTTTTTNTSTTTATEAAARRIRRPARSKIRRDDTVAIDDIESRQFIESHCIRNSGQARYAIKMVRKDVIVIDATTNTTPTDARTSKNNNKNVIPPSNKGRDHCQENDPHDNHPHYWSHRDYDDCKLSSDDEGEHRKIMGICDLAIETAFLSSLQHPNIMKLRAVANVDPFSDTYFLILDRLGDTLQKRIEVTWRVRERRLYSLWGRIFLDRRGTRRLEFFEHRLERAFDLASAIEYLHEKKIIHRDIKPDNIGFDLRDDIKLFDFGMARELRPELKVDDENYRLSKCGSPTYMAPEVWQGRPYNSSADVYSFGVVLYEMMSLCRAYDFCTADNAQDFAQQVFGKAERPTLVRLRAPPSIKDLLPYCWNNNPEYRCDMGTVNRSLRRELILLRKGDESTLPNFARRRSTFIFSTKGGNGRNASSISFEESVNSILTPHSNSAGRPSIGGRRSKPKFPTHVANLNMSFQSKGSLGTSDD